MGYIGAVAAIVGMLLTVFTLFKNKPENKKTFSPILYVGIALVLIGSTLSLFNI